MGILKEMIEQMSWCISVRWELQDMRFDAIYNDVRFIAMAVVSTALSCFIAVRSRR
ncbi:hypothetical protein DCAR_0933518 [Daucus carota subsp. sativus]|uniref:Uncharacterized protein n=1 Tax=Daucus carota subsp. sativus TaxID=79200 RepID=A0A175YEF4_DAUCS|nr:hypothetical protein DCAR_0933518 [Daucus carota subsp. sativus]